jgi:hypothetical protein
VGPAAWYSYERIGALAVIGSVLLVTLTSYVLVSGVIVANRAHISIIQASYGSSCATVPATLPGVNHYRAGNVTRIVKDHCANSLNCEMLVDPSRLGDPVSGCSKDLEVAFKCGPSDNIRRTYIAPEAAGKTLHINCSDIAALGKSSGPAIGILEASYGGNCAKMDSPAPGGNRFNVGNATTVARTACTGSNTCSLPIDVNQLGDPVPGCRKDFKVTYTCGQTDVKEVYLAGEANGKTLKIDCTKDD